MLRVCRHRLSLIHSFECRDSQYLSTVTPGLAHEEFKHSGSGESVQEPNTAVILHGLLGQGRNWRSFAKNIASALARKHGQNWHVLTLDLRCHGNSSAVPGLNPPHTMQACAQDVHSFVQQHLKSHPDLVVGHSMGGKVALEYVRQKAAAEKDAPRKPQKVWILDSQPGTVNTDMSDVSQVLQAVQTIKIPVLSRTKVLEDLKQQGFSESLVQWIVSNLVPSKAAPPGQAAQPLVWAFDVNGAADLYEDYKKVDAWSLLSSPPPLTTMNILRAARSDRWTEDMIKTLSKCAAAADSKAQQDRTAGSTKTHVLPNAGHWVHMDNPKGLMEMILSSMD